MKTWMTVLCAVALLVGCTKKNPEAETPKPVVDPPPVVVEWDQLKWGEDGLYLGGKPFTGVSVEKYRSGQKKFEIIYKDGRKCGLETHWDEDGQKRWEDTFQDGRLIAGKSWDKDGNLIRETPDPTAK